jgi:two-component system nitrate/nitrite response regulator NarL
MLSRTRFRPQACAIEIDDLTAIPGDGPILFIVGIEPTQPSICKRIRTRYPHSFIIAVGDETYRHYVRAALDEGANAALLSSVTPHALISALYSVMNGRLIIIDDRLWSSEIRPILEEQLSPPIQDASPPIQNISSRAAENDARTVEHLSAREIAILERIVRGDSNKHVARFFNIAEPTVKAHVKAIFLKIGASNRTQAATWALTHRLFDSVNNAPDPVSENRLWSEIQPILEEQLSPPIQDASPPIQNVSSWAVENDVRTVDLSAREIAILERIVRGDSNKHVARFFNIAEPTVKAHVKAIFRKIGASNRTQAATLALTHRLFDSNSAPYDPSLELQHGNGGNGCGQTRPSSSFRASGNGILKN